MCAIIHLNIYINNINLLGIYTLSKIQVKCHFLHIFPPLKFTEDRTVPQATGYNTSLGLHYTYILYATIFKLIESNTVFFIYKFPKTQHNPFFACRGSKGIHIKFKCTFFLLISLKKGNFLHQNLIAIVDMHNFHGTHT